MLGGLITFLVVVTAWVFFRADSVEQAWVLVKAMYGFEARATTLDAVIHGQLIELVAMSGRDLARLLALGLLWVWLLPNSGRLVFVSRWPLVTWGVALAVLGMLGVVVDRFGAYSPFLYFQF